MVRRTSIDAYYQIRDEGLLSKRRFQVYEVIVNHGPINANQIHQEHLSGLPQRSVTPRLIELMRLGVIAETHTGPCPITGHSSNFYVATEDLPSGKIDSTGKSIPRKELEARMVAYRETLVKIWKDKRTPDWVREAIRENTKQFRKEKEA